MAKKIEKPAAPKPPAAEKAKAPDPIEVRCPVPKRPGVSNRCGVKFSVHWSDEFKVWTGSCPEHGAQNFCGSVQGAAGVEQLRARDDDPENKPEVKEEAQLAKEAE